MNYFGKNLRNKMKNTNNIFEIFMRIFEQFPENLWKISEKLSKILGNFERDLLTNLV